MISRLLVKDVTQRLTAAEAYNHPWIQSIQEVVETNVASEAFDNMKKFTEAATFKKATLIYFAAKLPEKDLDELRRLFIIIDTNGDGKISMEEFQ